MPTLNVPYGYLTKKPGELKYQLFVVVPTSSGKNVDFSASPGSNGATTTINIVISDNGNVTNERQASVYNLDLTAGNTLAGDTTIEVKTEIVNQQSYTSTWSYSDAEDRDTITGSIALDSPYSVLLREANETTQRHPKVLIPSLGLGYDASLSTAELPADSSAATQISQIALQALVNPRTGPEWLEPSKIAGYVYFAPRDPEQLTDNHYFEARIIVPGQQVASVPKSRLKSRRYVQQEGLSLLQLIWGFLSRPFVSSRRA